MKTKSKDIAVCAVAVALMFALAWMPVAAFLIPLLFVACLYPYKQGLMVGVFAGAVCLTYALIAIAGSGLGVGAIVIVCAVWIVPRALVGLFTSLTFAAAKKMITGEGTFKRFLPYHLAISVGVLTNTILVVFSLLLFFPQMTVMGIVVQTGWWILLLIGLVELTVINLIVPMLCLSVGKALRLGEFAPKPMSQTTGGHSEG